MNHFGEFGDEDYTPEEFEEFEYEPSGWHLPYPDEIINLHPGYDGFSEYGEDEDYDSESDSDYYESDY
jgi:hypothetical protein